MSEAFEEVAADNNPLSSIDWRAVSRDLRRALENRNAEIESLRAELAEASSGSELAARQLLRACEKVNDLEAAARRDAEEIARLRKVLTFYAPGSFWYNAKIANDEGETAARALAPRPPEGKDE